MKNRVAYPWVTNPIPLLRMIVMYRDLYCNWHEEPVHKFATIAIYYEEAGTFIIEGPIEQFIHGEEKNLFGQYIPESEMTWDVGKAYVDRYLVLNGFRLVDQRAAIFG
jgi:hypothetical protein